MPGSLFLLSRGHLCKDNIATAKTGVIWVGGSNLKQTIQQERSREGNLEETVEKMVWLYACHWVSAAHSKLFKKLLKCSHQTELTPLQGCYLAFEHLRYSTCLSAEPGSSLFYSHSCAWMGNPLTSNHDQQIHNLTGQQNQSKKKNQFFSYYLSLDNWHIIIIFPCLRF